MWFIFCFLSIIFFYAYINVCFFKPSLIVTGALREDLQVGNLMSLGVTTLNLVTLAQQYSIVFTAPMDVDRALKICWL